MPSVKATREGLIGQTTASLYVIETHVPFIALPCEQALRRPVRVTANGNSVIALVLDVGPHYTDDDAYVLGNARPKAESDGSNGAGMDLGEYVHQALGLTEDNAICDWEFIG